MKKLDEVISTLERCVDWDSECEGCPYYEDNHGGLECELRNWEEVLYYLKEYYNNYGNLMASMNHHLRKIKELDEDNRPLTWDELRTMEGKPVWIEEDYGYKHWEIIDGVHEEDASFEAEYSFSKDTYGTEWRADRKERE